MITNAICESGWLTEKEKKKGVWDLDWMRTNYINEAWQPYVLVDGLITTLLLKLPNLLLLEIPSLGGQLSQFDFSHMSTLVDVISRVAAARASSTIRDFHFIRTPSTPFQNLREIHVQEWHTFSRNHFQNLAPVLALPNVRLVTSYQVHEDGYFAWPAHLPKSRVAYIEFNSSSITIPTIASFAEGLVGPCVLKQLLKHQPGRYWDPFDDECWWTELEIPWKDAKREAGEWIWTTSEDRSWQDDNAGLQYEEWLLQRPNWSWFLENSKYINL